jgi:4-diphosphocytidyl-2-C-methyl-D-erythritol kinase
MKVAQKTIEVKAPAKLNLTLNIMGRRADGYHLLDSLFVFCDLADEIRVEEADELRFNKISGPFGGEIEVSEQNLVMRAAKFLRVEADIQTGARLSLVKNIPVAAGLGGGSADAAATLNALNQLWDLHWPYERLEALAARLGADIPACVQSKPVIARGIGDALSPAAALPPCGLLLINPLKPTPTPAVFKAFAAAHPQITPQHLEALPGEYSDLNALVAAIKPRGNDLTNAAIAVQPAIAEILAVLRSTPNVAYAALSGSGATCFALFETVALASDAAKHIRHQNPLFWLWSGAFSP